MATYLTIDSKEDLTKLIAGAIKGGYLRKVDLRHVINWIDNVELPVKLQVSLNGVIGIAQNVVVRQVFGKNIDNALTNYVIRTIKAER